VAGKRLVLKRTSYRLCALPLLPQILTARSIIEAAIHPLKSDRTGGKFASAKCAWRGVAAEPTRNWVVPTASPIGTVRSPAQLDGVQ
jgi:hypothetical protein